ncbi:MAG: U32 family peptidase [Desulfobulbaceae bacterium]|nr:U32 family peptidase [Desulfobulbaceae bacterium]
MLFPKEQSSAQALPELLAPAGSLEKLQVAVHYGADAVYLGGKQHSLRARAANFSEEDLRTGVAYAHANGVKVYATVNIFAHNDDLDGLVTSLRLLAQTGVDACIVADPGVIRLAREHAPDMPLHLSTQANVTNQESAVFWQEQGLARINLARELGLKEIEVIRTRVGCQLEVFVHGALCISYSGRCLLSTYFAGRDANQGDCAQPCRYSYALVEEKRPGQYFPIEEDERGAYIFNSRDLCLLAYLPKLVKAGVDSLKIEGRMKSVGYVGAVVHLYRQALQWIQTQAAAGAELTSLSLPQEFFQQLNAIGTRGHTENFFLGIPDASDMLHHSTRIAQTAVPVGIVRSNNPLTIETRHLLALGDELECLLPGRLQPLPARVTALTDEKGQALERANPNRLVRLSTEPVLKELAPHSLLRKKLY